MPLELHRYRALQSRDGRFDGLFFVGVQSTGIYCRPICPAKTPLLANCRFYETAEQAEQAGFRPCLRCRPELAPGSAPVDDGQRIAQLIVQRLQEGGFDEESGVDAVARQFDLSARQLRRIIRRELGVPPIQLLITRRLLLAKQLLTETALPMVQVAFASGFSSLRRFNDAFAERYGMAPAGLRKKVHSKQLLDLDSTSTLLLCYREPYDWEGVLAFLRARALVGVESVTDTSYSRTVRWGAASGWMRVRNEPGKSAVSLEFSHGLITALPFLIARTRALFDLDARPVVIADHLGRDPRLAIAVSSNPGLRVPGAFHGFELGLRAILGQQISVAAATTLAGRFVEAFGEPIVTPVGGLYRTTPDPARVARATVDEIARHGIIAARARTVIALAAAQANPQHCLESGLRVDPDIFLTQLQQLPGIGSWTAHTIAMRALRWPDAFPKEDVALRNRLGGVTAKQAEALSQPWRPWRSYAVLHLWGMPKVAKSAAPSGRA